VTAVVVLPPLALPVPNSRVLALLAATPRRDPGADMAGRTLYVARLAMTVLAHTRQGSGWLCTAATAHFDTRTPIGVAELSNIELAASAEVRDACHPTEDFTAAEVRAAWMIEAWSRWPGGRMIQLAQALVEDTQAGGSTDGLTVRTDAHLTTRLTQRVGLPHSMSVQRLFRDLVTAGLLVVADPTARTYRLQLGSAAHR
jgi:hypothetical protein